MPFALVHRDCASSPEEPSETLGHVCVCVKKGQELRAAEGEIFRGGFISNLCNAPAQEIRPKSCSGRPPTQIRFTTKQLQQKVGGSGNYGRISPPWNRLASLLMLPFEQSETQEKKSLIKKENKEKAKENTYQR